MAARKKDYHIRQTCLSGTTAKTTTAKFTTTRAATETSSIRGHHKQNGKQHTDQGGARYFFQIFHG